MANAVYNKFKNLTFLQDINLLSATVKVALVEGYSPDVDNHEFFSDVLAYEVSGTNYTSGGSELQNKSLTRDDLNDRVKFDADDVEWTQATLTADGAIVYSDEGVTSASPLITFVDFGEDKIARNTTFKITWSAYEGIMYLS